MDVCGAGVASRHHPARGFSKVLRLLHQVLFLGIEPLKFMQKDQGLLGRVSQAIRKRTEDGGAR